MSIVPLLIEHAAGRLLGAAMLAAAARNAGQIVDVINVEAELLANERLGASIAASSFVGDLQRDESILACVSADLARCLLVHARRWVADDAEAESVLWPQLDIDGVTSAASSLAAGASGRWRTGMRRSDAPDLVGFSAVYGGQVRSALALTNVARRLWPHALIVWGEAHVSALQDEIARAGVAGRSSKASSMATQGKASATCSTPSRIEARPAKRCRARSTARLAGEVPP